jgi:hypothetical protein
VDVTLNIAPTPVAQRFVSGIQSVENPNPPAPDNQLLSKAASETVCHPATVEPIR